MNLSDTTCVISEPAAIDEYSPLSLLRRARDLIDVQATGCTYGYFCGEDPRDFEPDPECSTEAERAQHAVDCAAWDRGEKTSSPNGCEWTTAGAAGLAGALVDPRTGESRDVAPDAPVKITRCSYGLGTTYWKAEADREDLAALDALIARIEARGKAKEEPCSP